MGIPAEKEWTCRDPDCGKKFTGRYPPGRLFCPDCHAKEDPRARIARLKKRGAVPSSQPELTEASDIKGDTWNISLPRTRIHTLEQLVKFCEIDLELWEVERFIANKWEVAAKVGADKDAKLEVEPLYQIKAFLKKKRHVETARQEIERLRKEAEKFSPRHPRIKPATARRNSGVMAEYSIFDHHFGALIWGRETGGADYDSGIAKKCWEDALTSLIQRTRGYQPEKALIVLGNDQQNADNRSGTTEKGTRQDVDSRYQKVFEISFETSRWGIDALVGEFGAVEVVMVPGNHDPLATWHLGHSLASWYRRSSQVTVRNEPSFRKYYEWGVNMLLFTHGSGGKLEDYDKTMAAEEPALWGRTRYREAHTGDKHHRRVIEMKGATVRILSSLRPPCAWSSENHYIGSTRSAEAFAWSKTEGLIGTALHSILEKP